MNQRADSDEALALLASHGDREAFNTLVRRHKGALYGFIRRYVGHADDAHDVLQDTLLATWTSFRRYDPSRLFLPWFRTIALNKCRDHARRQRVRRLFLLAHAREPEPQHEPTPLPSEIADEQRRLQRLDQAIAALPSFYKEPLLLTAVSGLSQKEAAALLKTSPKAIEMRVRRARAQLKKAVGSDL